MQAGNSYLLYIESEQGPCVHVCMCEYACMRVCMNVCVHACVYVFVRVCTCVYELYILLAGVHISRINPAREKVYGPPESHGIG